jgi:hypothetical protein
MSPFCPCGMPLRYVEQLKITVTAETLTARAITVPAPEL